MSRFVIASTLAVLLAGAVVAQIPKACLDCICEVESGCRAPSPCCRWDVNSYSCGEFQIKEPYWQDASIMSGYDTGSDWQSCTCTYSCSVQTVQAYAARYTTASRIGHTPTCEDYARNHNGGPNGYSCTCTDAYWAKVQSCLNSKKYVEEAQ